LIAINTATDEVVGEIVVGAAHNVAVSPDSRWAYVGSQAQGAPALVLVDLNSMAIESAIPIPSNPRGLSFSPDGQWLYFTRAGSDAVGIVDVESGQPSGEIEIGPSPHFPTFVAEGPRVLVDSQGRNDLALVDANLQSVVGRIPVGDRPHWTASSSDGHFAYVTNEGSNDLTIVDLRDARVVATMPIGNAPRKIAVQGVAPGSGSGSPVETHIANFTFDATVQAAPGQAVAWHNLDAVPHTVTSLEGFFRSDTIAPGGSFTASAPRSGVYPYRCDLHAFMRGELIVS
jgi:YVTN family beta-propeller protein